MKSEYGNNDTPDNERGEARRVAQRDFCRELTMDGALFTVVSERHSYRIKARTRKGVKESFMTIEFA